MPCQHPQMRKKEHEKSHDGIKSNYVISADQLGISYVLCLQHKKESEALTRERGGECNPL